MRYFVKEIISIYPMDNNPYYSLIRMLLYTGKELTCVRRNDIIENILKNQWIDV